MNTEPWEGLRARAMARPRDCTEAINAFICIAAVATTVKDDDGCLRTLLDVLEQQRGLAGFAVVQGSEADRKAFEVAAYLDCLRSAILLRPAKSPR